jgi:predicted component of type VI protein secretion system
VKRALLVALALVLAGCGSKKPDAAAVANARLLDSIPVYPGTQAPKTTPGQQFGARDWTLPAGANANAIVAWYERRLTARRWRIVGQSFHTIRATKGGAAISVGVRGRTLELIARSGGG